MVAQYWVEPLDSDTGTIWCRLEVGALHGHTHTVVTTDMDADTIVAVATILLSGARQKLREAVLTHLEDREIL